MADDRRIVAIGLLTAHDLERLGSQFSRVYPVDSAPCFGEILSRIDAADRDLWRERDNEHRIITERTRTGRR